jgi:hypothetical protein
MKALVITGLCGLALSGCALLQDGRPDELPSAAEMGAGDCHPAGPHDVAAPGDWICDRGADQDPNVRPRHRVEDRG